MRLGTIAVALILIAAPLAGCAETGDVDGPSTGGTSEHSSATSYSYSSGGSEAAQSDEGSFQAPSGEARISASAGGTGRLTVTVADAGGDTVFEETYTGSGGSSTSDDVDGEPGQWTVTIEVAYWSGGFSFSASGS